MSNSSTFFLSHYLYHSASTHLFEYTMHSTSLLPHSLFLYIYMFIHDIQHPYTLVRPIRQGLKRTP